MNQLLSTKFFIPKTRSNLVSRPRLLARLNDSLHCKLSIISAPAGFGKTTLVSEWAVNSEYPIAWLSLNKEDGNLIRFLTYLVTTLQTVQVDFGKDIHAVLQSSQSSMIEPVLTMLLNEITTITTDFFIILDDYHLIDSKQVDNSIAFLLDNLPPNMHLIITTREDPHLPLARLRAQGQLIEIRVADLRFTLNETTTFLNQMLGFNLSKENTAILENRTEGWIAGLQLAALSMRNQVDASDFINSFAGDHRYIVDYLVEEVLQSQDEKVRIFLLQTSILEQMNGLLCTAVTGQEDCSNLLEILERNNLFVVSLDNRRYWYRYHHLFADVLRAYLLEEQSDQITILHKRASEWYEKNKLLANAIHHSFASKDLNRTAGLIELAWSDMDKSRQSTAWLDWVIVLPDELVRKRPVLSIGYAWALLDNGELEAAESRIRDAEQFLNQITNEKEGEKNQPLEYLVSDLNEFKFLPATISTARTYLALSLGDIQNAIKYAQHAIENFPENEYHRRGTTNALLGLALLTNGNLEEADEVFTDAMSDYEKAGNILFSITGTFILAEIRSALGHLRQAFEKYQQSLQLAQGKSKYVLWGTADLHTGLSELFLKQNKLVEAAEHLVISKELGEQANFPRWYFRWCIAKAQLQEALGDLGGALELLIEAERNYIRGPVPDIRPISALKTQVWIAQNRLDEAWVWVKENNLTLDDEISYLHEFEYITLARLLIAQYRNDEKEIHIENAVRLLNKLEEIAEEGRRMGSLIEILVQKALAYEAQGDIVAAFHPLERALKVAEPEEYVGIFIDEGEPMSRLLSEAANQDIMSGYVDRLLASLKGENQNVENKSKSPDSQSLIEPLSERELEILRLIAKGLSNREISERLFLAMPTVKGHNRNIFGKLQVKRRTEAVASARELGLL